MAKDTTFDLSDWVGPRQQDVKQRSGRPKRQPPKRAAPEATHSRARARVKTLAGPSSLFLAGGLNAVGLGRVADAYMANLARRLTYSEHRKQTRDGTLHPEADIFSRPLPVMPRSYWGDSSWETWQAKTGHALAGADAWLRSFGEGTKVFAFTTAGFWGAASVGATAARKLGEEHAPPAAVSAAVLSAPSVIADSPETPVRRVAAGVSAEDLQAATNVINSFITSAAHAPNGTVTNDRHSAICATFAATDILTQQGLLRENGLLASLDAAELASTLGGKFRTESGWDDQALAVNGRTEDRARGLAQFLPGTAFNVLKRHQSRLPAELIPTSLRSALQGTSYRNLSANQREVVRAALLDQTAFTHNGMTCERGATLSAILAGLLADEFDVPQDLRDRYGPRMFLYIGHQAGEGSLNRIVRALGARDALPNRNSEEWRLADRELRQTILSSTHFSRNMSIYATSDAVEERQRRIAARERAIEANRTLPRNRRAAVPAQWRANLGHVLSWDALRARIDSHYGESRTRDLPSALETLYRAYSYGQVRLARGPESRVELQAPTHVAGDPASVDSALSRHPT